MRLWFVIAITISTFTLADEVIPVSFESRDEAAKVCGDVEHSKQFKEIISAIDDALEVADTVERGTECRFYEKFRSQGVPINALKQSLTFYKNNKSKFKNKNYISIADYSQNSRKKRFFLLNLRTGEVEGRKVSHGSGSLGGVKYADATIKNGKVIKSSNHNGMMKRCRIPKRKKGAKHDQWALTRAGFFKTGEFYMSNGHNEAVKGSRGWPTFKIDGRKYNGMRMDGLVNGVNNKSRNQGVVMHEAYYNRGDVMGRSFGCPAFVPKKGRAIMEKISNGSLYYSYVPIEGCQSDHQKVLKVVKGWEKMCD